MIYLLKLNYKIIFYIKQEKTSLPKLEEQNLLYGIKENTIKESGKPFFYYYFFYHFY